MNKPVATPSLFRFDNSYVRDLSGCYLPWHAEQVPAPRFLQFNHALADELGLDTTLLNSPQGLAVFSGNLAPPGAEPIAQAYAGHQFGSFAHQLGDGRALLLGEIIDRQGKRRDLQLKGSGRTPFSRSADGKAAVGPVLREYLMGEAMHALGIPTTRALAAVSTGEEIYRETPLPGAVLTRIAASHLRVGTFEFFAARGDTASLQRLLAYTLKRHYPEQPDTGNPALTLLEGVMQAQARLIARWMQVGFIHGVMNTDNTTLSGETIDYGPCAFMDRYDSNTVFSSIDRQWRYAYGRQPAIIQWNLVRFAETLIPLVDEDEEEAVRLLTDSVRRFMGLYQGYWLEGMRAKLGLSTTEDGDQELAESLLSAMEAQQADFTLVFRHLAGAVLGNTGAVRAQFRNPAAVDSWLLAWQERLQREASLPAAERAAAMNRVNPLYIPRNHKVEEALNAAVQERNLQPFETLLALLEQPFTEVRGMESYTQPAALGAQPYRTFCGT